MPVIVILLVSYVAETLRPGLAYRPADDSYLNCQHAQARGWTTVHLVDAGEPEPATKASKYQIRSLDELRTLFPQFFKPLQGSQTLA